MNVWLLGAVRKVIHSDSDPIRRELFERLRQTSTPVRVASALHGLAGRGWMGAAMVAGYGAKGLLSLALPAEADASPMLGVASQENARRKLNQVSELLGDGQVRQVRVSLRVAFASRVVDLAAALTTVRRLRRYLRLVHRMNRRHEFLVSCRVAALIGAYPVARRHLQRHRPGAVIVSSDSNPEEIAFTSAARAAGIATVFVSHAYPTPVSPPLDFALSVIEGEAALAVYRRQGPVRGKVVFAGVPGQSVPIDVTRFLRPAPAIGIFAPKVLVWHTFTRIVEDARARCGARQIVIRWHPSMLERPRVEQWMRDPSFVVETPSTESLASVVARCDWVIADMDSNVHLDVLKIGVPTIAVAHLGIAPPERADLYGFVANGVIPAPLPSLAAFDPQPLMAFFGTDWPERFRRHDASYLRPADEVADEVRQALRDSSFA